MSSPESVFSQFIEDWNAGRRPRVEDYLARVETSDRDELAGQITTFIAYAPTPDFGPETLAQMRDDPLLSEVREASRQPAGMWPTMLPRLRARVNVEIRELGTRLAGTLGLGADAEAKTAEYLGEMEAGTLDPRGVSQRVLDALGSALGVSGRDLAEAGDFGLGGGRPAAALYRAEEIPEELSSIEILADGMLASSPPGWDAVDDLFLGGRGEVS